MPRARLIGMLLLAALIAALASATIALAQPASCAATSSGAEGVEDFASDVVVNPDDSLSVHETIRVLARGQQLTTSIHRDFPSHFQDSRGHVYAPMVTVLDVRQDGAPVAFVTRHLPEGARVYLGPPDASLAPGEYTYTLSYRVNGALGFFADGDQLYWPITPPSWAIPIACATATVSVPPDAPVIGIRADGWIGPRSSPFAVIPPTIDRSGVVTFVAPGPLAYQHQLTVEVSWPRGYVREPASIGQSWPLVGSGDTVRIELIGLGVIVLFSTPGVLLVRRRSRLPPAAPSTRPPDQLSPAATRFLATSSFDERTLAATIVDLAVKGFLNIREVAPSAPGAAIRLELVKVERREGGARLAPEEGAALAELLGSTSACPIGGERFRELRRASAELKRLVTALYEDRYFTHNARYQIPALVVATVTMVAATLSEMNRAALDPRAGAIWLVMAATLVFGTALVLGAALLIGQLNTPRRALTFAAVALAAYLFPLIILYYVQSQLAGTSLAAAVLLGVIGLGLALLRKLLATPTRDGRVSRARVEDFRAFLVASGPESAEDPQRRWNGIWEAFLPYAVALEVDDRWAWSLARGGGSASRCDERLTDAIWYQMAETGQFGAGPEISIGEVLAALIREGLRGPTAKAGDADAAPRPPWANGRP